ncbi:bacteriocin cleavage/export ABC transporter [Marivirga lumbricoides]|uniref:Bacteriocin cleavage/export ABC transporter n=1 Tax=Marivirga lumbricoides TaxID=1046115 RepID=A0ABQ1MEA5_9BACT|nr:bacteriocin cleavage/export ABC transporter [Marivirga lumbricoides]
MVLQNGAAECGTACLSSVFKYHGFQIGYEYIKEQTGAGNTGTTLLGLMEGAISCGFNAEGFKVNDPQLLSKVKEPVIIPVTINDYLNHYYVYYGFQNGKHVVGDPGFGIRHLDEDHLMSEWKTKTLLQLTPGKKVLINNSQNGSTRSEVFNILKKNIPFLSNILFIGLIIAIVNISISIFLQKLVDDIIPNTDWQKFYTGMLVFGILLLLRLGLSYFNTEFLLKQSYNINVEQIKLFFKKIFKLPWATIKARRTGDFIARLNDSAKVQKVILNIFGSTSVQFLILITSLVAVSVYNIYITGFISICLLIYVVIYTLIFSNINSAYKKLMGSYAANESNYISTIQGANEITAFQAEKFFESKTARIYEQFQKSVYDTGQISNKLMLFNGFVSVIFLIGIFSYSSILTFNRVISTGEMVAIISLSNFMLPALSSIINSIIQIQEANIALNRIEEFTNTYDKPGDKKNIHVHNIDSLRFEKLSFKFPGRNDLFTDVSFNMVKGEWVSILGENGTGKSTIFKLILGFLKSTAGEITINGSSLNHISKHSILDNIGYCPQDIHLFNGNVLYNLCFSDDIKTQKETLEFVKKSGLTPFFNQLPQGFMTIIGEGGVQISGGQKQLIGLTRALLQKPSLLLLDEPTSAMDKKTSSSILNLLNNSKLDSSILLITHEIDVASHADRIYILENGKITHGETPKELLNSSNFFSASIRDLKSLV